MHNAHEFTQRLASLFLHQAENISGNSSFTQVHQDKRFQAHSDTKKKKEKREGS